MSVASEDKVVAIYLYYLEQMVYSAAVTNSKGAITQSFIFLDIINVGLDIGQEKLRGLGRGAA